MTQVEIHRRGSPEEDFPIPGIRRRRISGVEALMQELRISEGAGAPLHSHDSEQIVIMLDGTRELTVETGPGERPRRETLGPGDVAVIPSGVVHTGVALTNCRLIDVFSPPTEATGVDGASARSTLSRRGSDAEGVSDGDGDGGGDGGGE